MQLSKTMSKVEKNKSQEDNFNSGKKSHKLKF